MKRIFKWVAGGLLVCLVLIVTGAIDPRCWAVLTNLPFGWWHFLRRNLAQITWNWSVIGMAVVCSAILIVLGNQLLGALYGHNQHRRSPERPPRPWRWKWTVGLYLSVWLMFAIAFGAAGVFRHTTWLLHEKGPWYRAQLYAYLELNQAEMAVETARIDTDGSQEAMQKALLLERSPSRRERLLCEDFDVILYADGTNQVEAYVIIPRDAELLKEKVFRSSQPHNPGQTYPLAELQRTLADLEARYPRGK